MELIPVVDLMGGEVVHARHGQRARYRPLRSTLCRSSGVLDVIRGLLSLHPFRTVYLADLDAIAGAGDNRDAVDAIHRHHPGLELWLDRGTRDARGLRAFAQRRRETPVLGSETLADTGILAGRTAAPARRDDLVLSLDFDAGGLLGPRSLLCAPRSWPRKVIVMTLARVGSAAGPDLRRLAEIAALAPDVQRYAAGGVRDGADLERLAAAGVSGALLASALHDGRITGRWLGRHATARATGPG